MRSAASLAGAQVNPARTFLHAIPAPALDWLPDLLDRFDMRTHGTKGHCLSTDSTSLHRIAARDKTNDGTGDIRLSLSASTARRARSETVEQVARDCITAVTWTRNSPGATRPPLRSLPKPVVEQGADFAHRPLLVGTLDFQAHGCPDGGSQHHHGHDIAGVHAPPLDDDRHFRAKARRDADDACARPDVQPARIGDGDVLCLQATTR